MTTTSRAWDGCRLGAWHSLLARQGAARRLALQLALAVCMNGRRKWVRGATDLRFLPDPMEHAPPVFYGSWKDELEESSRRLRALDDAWEAARGVLQFCDLAAHGPLGTAFVKRVAPVLASVGFALTPRHENPLR